MLTDALALTKPQTETTQDQDCDENFRVVDAPDGAKAIVEVPYAERVRGFGSNVQQLGRGVRRVPRA